MTIQQTQQTAVPDVTVQAPGAATTAPAGTETAQAAMRLRELAFGAMCAGTVRAAARLGVPDALGEHPETAEELAKTLGVDPGALRRLLRALVSQDVFAEDADGRFRHTEASRLLRADAPRNLRDIALWTTEPWTWQAWPRLEDAVRTGAPVVPALYGKGFFQYLHEDAPESAEVFDRAMTQSSAQTARILADTLDLSGVAHIADIGGGQGYVLATLMETHPGVSGTLLDLPGVVAAADPRLRTGVLADRVTLVPGDCREDIPVDADLYLLKNILEWDDDSTARALRNVVAAGRRGARVVVIENLVDDTQSMRFTTAMDLLLLLNVGGHKHTQAGLSALIEDAGLKIEDIRPLTPSLHVIESRIPV